MIKNKIKRIAFLVIIIGILLIIGAITSYLIKHSSKKETKFSKEEILNSWIGNYQYNNNQFSVVIHNDDTMEIIFIYSGNDFVLNVTNFNYYQLKVENDFLNGIISKKENGINVELNYKNENVNNINEVYSKVKSSCNTWTGIYSNEIGKLFITQINDVYLTFSFYYYYNSNFVTLKKDVNEFNDQNINFNLSSDETIIIKKQSCNELIVEYIKEQEKDNLISGTYKKDIL